MSDISKHVLEQIKDEGIKPRPRWQFVLMTVLLGIALVVAIIIGGLVTGLIYLKLFNVQWDYVSFAGEHGLPNILEVLPVIWIALLMLVLLLSVWAFERTENGYKYKPVWLVLAAIVLSAALGGVLFATKGAELFDELLMDNLPPYQEMEQRLEVRFHLPEMGILPGHVVEVESLTSMQLEDLREHVWEIQLVRPSFLPPKDFTGLQEGSMVFVIGEKTDEDNFVAYDVRKRGILLTPLPIKGLLKKKMMQKPAVTKVLYDAEKVGQ